MSRSPVPPAPTRRGDARQRRRQEEVEPLRGRRHALAVALPLAETLLELRVGDAQARLHLDREVLAIRAPVLGVELAVHVRHLPPEDVGRALPQRQVDAAPAGEAARNRLDPRPDERLCVLGPGDADAELLERGELVPPEVRDEHLQHPRARLDVAGHRAGVVVAGGERPAAVERYEPVARLEADDAAACGGDPDRAAGVGAERRVGEPGRERGRRAPARAARDATRGGGVGHGAEVRVLGGRAVGELVQVRLADVRVARLFEQPHGGRGRRRHVPGEDGGAVGRLQPGRVEQILDRQPYARLGGRLRL